MKKILLTGFYTLLVITTVPMLAACESIDNWTEEMVRGKPESTTVTKAAPPLTSTYVPTPKNIYAGKTANAYPSASSYPAIHQAPTHPVTAYDTYYNAAPPTPVPAYNAAPAVPYPVVEKLPARVVPASPYAAQTYIEPAPVPTPPPASAYIPTAPAYVAPAPAVIPTAPVPAITPAPTPAPAPAAKTVVAEKPVIVEKSAPFVPASSFDPQGDYTLGPGDQLRITVYGQEELTGQYKVDAKGFISFPLIGKVPASGRTTTQMEETITNGLNTGYIVDPRVSIEVMNYRPVYVLGEVREPGKFEYAPGMTILQAIASAGGYTYRADEEKVEVTRRTGSAQETLTVNQSEMVKPGDTIVVKRRWF